MDSDELSVRLYGLMRHLGMKKKEDLAKKLGYSRTQIYMIERGEVEPTARFWSRLEEVERESGFAAHRGKAVPNNNEQSRTSDQSGRLAEDPAEYGRGVRMADVELQALASLLMLHAARLTAGEKIDSDIPHARTAMERALKDRGVLPK
jgi:hypothetical protein